MLESILKSEVLFGAVGMGVLGYLSYDPLKRVLKEGKKIADKKIEENVLMRVYDTKTGKVTTVYK